MADIGPPTWPAPLADTVWITCQRPCLANDASSEKSAESVITRFFLGDSHAITGRWFLVAASYDSRFLRVPSSALTSATGTSHQVPMPGMRDSGSTGTTT